MIAYFFPPIGGSGALRPLKLAKYLPQFGWDPIVLTPRNPDWYYGQDPDLLGELPPSAHVITSPFLRAAWLYRTLNPFRLSSIDRLLRRYVIHPDDQVGWIPGACRRGRSVISQHNVRAIFSTSAPMSCHVIARRLKQATHLPWVADFRDEWYENPDLPRPTRFHRRFHYNLERHVAQDADRITVTSPIFCRHLAKHTGTAGKCATVFMGYDPEDFQPAPVVASAARRHFVLAFAGMFYGSFRPIALIETLNDLIRRGAIQPEGFRLRFVGANAPADLLGQADNPLCEFTGFLPHARVLGELAAADALLLLLSRERGQDVIPSKAIEYLGTKKPILALVPPDGAVARLLSRTGAALVAEIDDRVRIEQHLLTLYQAWQRGVAPTVRNDSEISQYNQRLQTARLAAILNSVTEQERHEEEA